MKVVGLLSDNMLLYSTLSYSKDSRHYVSPAEEKTVSIYYVLAPFPLGKGFLF